MGALAVFISRCTFIIGWIRCHGSRTKAYRDGSLRGIAKLGRDVFVCVCDHNIFIFTVIILIIIIIIIIVYLIFFSQWGSGRREEKKERRNQNAHSFQSLSKNTAPPMFFFTYVPR